ncbi:N-acetyltransferase [Pedobacter sp. N23S346]|uniref:N-acetyltransferase n=1 Tax=Pedobacter sp. N23S346 TaxID=3402750 RepID=UPI003AC56D5F
MNNPIIFVRIATKADAIYADEIVSETLNAAIIRGSGISKRTPESIIEKMETGKAVIAVTSDGEWVGFSYFEAWEHGDFISNSGLIVKSKFRNSGVARCIKNRIFNLSRRNFPQAKIFSITSGAAIMKMNSQLGFEPVTFDQITKDEDFWAGCSSCINFDILERKNRCNCLCTAMLFSPEHIDHIVTYASFAEKKQHLLETH